MVSTRRRTPTNPKPRPSPTLSRRRCHRKPKESPLKTLVSAPALVVASIDKSIRTCRRRLIKIFARLTTTLTSTPKRRRHGFRRLNAVRDESPIGRFPDLGLPIPFLPPTEKRTVFLDLDETLVHSVTGPTPEKYDFLVSPVIEGQTLNFYVLKRPGVDELLAEVSKRFEIVVFTAGLEEYASLVLNRLDLDRRLFTHRLYRSSCREVDGRLVKDLVATGRELDRVVIVDDNPHVYSLQPDNAIPISPFTDDLADGELRRLMKFFEAAEQFEDMRDAVKFYLTDGNGNLQVETNATLPAVTATTSDAVSASESSSFIAVSV